jgi:hypothetical protein
MTGWAVRVWLASGQLTLQPLQRIQELCC